MNEDKTRVAEQQASRHPARQTTRREFLDQSAAIVAGLAGFCAGGQCPAGTVPAPAARITVCGKVFLDEAGDGRWKTSAKGIAAAVISDGHELVRTDKDGNYALQTSPGRLVFIVLPKGYRSSRTFYQTAEQGKNLNFPLTAWPQSNCDTVRFAQITDIHIAGRGSGEQFASDLQQLNRCSPKLTFVLATGDLADAGMATQFADYRKATAVLNVPLFNVVGNHDVADGGANYPKYLGPLYYAFNAGNYHFIVLDSVHFDDAQRAWVLKELQTAPAGSTRIAALHYFPDAAQMKWFAANGIRAVLSGHWHGSRVAQTRGVLDLNTPPFRFGGIDRSPRAFRLVEVSHGRIRNELVYSKDMQSAMERARAGRRGHAEHVAWVAETDGIVGLSSPAVAEGVVVIGMSDRGNLEECGVSAFDAASGKKRWHFKTDTAVKGSVAVGNGRVFALSQGGTLFILELKTGRLISTVGLMSDCQRWEVLSPLLVHGTVYLGNPTCLAAVDAGSAAVGWRLQKTGSDWWPSVYGAFVSDGDELLRSTREAVLALDRNSGRQLWEARIRPGTMAGSGKGVVREDIFYAADNCYLVARGCCDGKMLWRSREDVGDTASVPAVAGDRVVLGTTDGRVCAFSLSNGSLIWGFRTGKSISDLSPYARGGSDVTASAVIRDDTVYVGGSDGVFYALSLATGRKLWSHAVGVPIATAAVAAEGGVFAASYDGALYRFQ